MIRINIIIIIIIININYYINNNNKMAFNTRGNNSTQQRTAKSILLGKLRIQ